MPRSDGGVEYSRTERESVQRCYQRNGGNLAADVSGNGVVIGNKALLAKTQKETVFKTNNLDETMNVLNFGDEVSEHICVSPKRIEELTLLDCADKDINDVSKKAYQDLLKEVYT